MPDKEANNNIDIDFGIGRMSFGGLFRGLGNLIDLAAKLNQEKDEGKGEIKGLPDGMRGVFGFSIKTLDGKPVIESFGNIKETAKGPVVEEVREPLVDIFDEGDRILIIAELPGVTESQINIEIDGDILRLNATDKERKYAKELLLPGKVIKESLQTSYRNGILEITLKKAK